VVGSELVCTSITSTGNGTGSTTDPTMARNPHLKFTNDSRGYVNTKITKDALTADFRVLDYVTTPGSPVGTKASFEIRDGVPGAAGTGLTCHLQPDDGGGLALLPATRRFVT
jgi:alkaline phosphatase D